MDQKIAERPAKIFISHSSQDIEFVQPLVTLFGSMGLNSENMFCSSVPGYNVPLDKNIFDYLKMQFKNYDLHVIFVLSENYYNSAACLNEMGAAWILQHKYTSVLIPQFEFHNIKGAIDPMRISIMLDAEKYELKDRLNQLRNEIIDEFHLVASLSQQSIWECHRDEFIRKVNSGEVYWKQLNRLKEEKRPFNEWILPLQKLIQVNPDSCDAIYMLGTIYAELGDEKMAHKYLKMAGDLSQNKELDEKINKKLKQLGI